MKRWFPPAILTVLFVLFRVPVLLNPGFINSDGARAALQAGRMLQGEWEWLHWQRDYLTSIDSVMAVPFFAVLGATPLVLMCVTMLGQLICTWLAYSIVARRLTPWTGLVVTLPLVFMTMALNIYLYFNIRQWCVSLALLAFWLIDRSSESARPRLMVVLGLLVTFLAMFVDLFAVQFVPGLILFAILSALDGTLKWRPRKSQLLAVLGGTGLGVLLLQTLRVIAHIQTGRAHLNTQLIPRNWPLLLEQCLPWLIGSKLYAFTPAGSAEFSPSPLWFAPVQFLGAFVFAGILVSGAALFFVQRIPWRVRVLGAVGSGVAFTNVAGFLCSSTAHDLWAARLLLPLVLTLPLTLAPLAYLLGKRLTVAILPYLLTVAIGGWLSYGVLVDGPVPRRTARGAMTEDLALGEFLRARGIHYAAADYWVAYRLTFIFREEPIVVSEASEDIYPRWRQEFDAATEVAYLVHPSSPALSSQTIETQLAGRNLPFEKLTVEGFTVLLVKQR